MVDKKVNFELVPSFDRDDMFDEMSGHATTVVRMDSLSGPFVEKFVKDSGAYALRRSVWLEKQIATAQISNELRAKHNPHYYVPKTFISNGHVREQYVDGINADEYKGDKSDFIPVIAHFINDMSELRPVQFRRNKSVPGTMINDVADLDEKLDRVCKFNVVREQNLQLVREVYEFLRDLPENNMFVFGHNDLHPGNVFVDPETGRVTIIDFELSGYQPMSYMLYAGMRSGALLWDYVNKLPRTTNSGLNWNYDANIAELYKFVRRVLYQMENVSTFDMSTSVRSLERINDLCNVVLRKKFAMLKLKYQDSLLGPEMPLVPMSHYGARQ